MNGHKTDLLGIFAHHKVAANLLMLMMLLSGALALDRLNVQFFPNFALDFVTVRVVWTGASAEDTEDGITNPLEQRLKNVDNLNKITSTSSQGISSITLEFIEGTDPLIALEDTRRLVDEFRNLPQDAEQPEIANVSRYEPIARLLITGSDDANELRQLARRFESELLARGIDKVDFNGLPEQEIAIEIDSGRLQELERSLDQMADRIGDLSRDQPAGILGKGQAARELRSLDQRRDEWGFSRLPAITEGTQRIDLGTIADIRRQAREGQVTLTVNGKPTLELLLRRSESGDSFEAASVLEQWLQDTLPGLPPGIEVTVYDESWQLIKERIMLLVKNGGGGLVLVVAILYVFLTGRVAFWVAVGIPVSFAATLFILYLAGGSINMISLFALIMALGIIVDDAIVVGEDALTHYQMGEDPLLAAEGGARRMLAPVMASSLTTIAAFIPLTLVGGIIGNILFAIPLVIISVILASLLESFLVLPGHLRHSFLRLTHDEPKGIRRWLDHGFIRFRENVFRPLAMVALRNRGTTISAAVAMLIISFGLVAGGRLNFVFFPTPEPQVIFANATFVAGTPRDRVDEFLNHLHETVFLTEKEFDRGQLINHAVTRHGTLSGDDTHGLATGDQLGSIQIELAEPDEREVRNDQFIREWRENIQLPAGLENFIITSRRAGPPGRDLTIRMTGTDADSVKAASLELLEALKGVPGVSEVQDDMPYGREQLIYRLTPEAEASGLTVVDLGRQLRTAFDGRLVQIFQDGPEEVEVRVKLPRTERDRLGALERFNIRLPSGEFVPLSTMARWDTKRGFEALRHAEGRLAAEVTGDVDTRVSNVDRILEALQESTLRELSSRYGIDYSFEGRSADQRETLADMRKGVLLGLILIYLVLAWVFASYGWPLVVITAIPFGFIGALLGHWLMGLDLTILSMFGLFGLSGIVVNDSIILVTFYKRLRDQGMTVDEAVVEASCQRLRAVLLTSLTTIGGLLPLLFETSFQAQFLIPMATSIAFGLGFATMLILLVIPSLLSVHESIHEGLRRWLGKAEPVANA